MIFGTTPAPPQPTRSPFSSSSTMNPQYNQDVEGSDMMMEDNPKSPSAMNGGGGMSALSALMRSSPNTTHPTPISISGTNGNGTSSPPPMNHSNTSTHSTIPSSFPNQPQNSPSFPPISNLSPYAQPFPLPGGAGFSAGGGFSYNPGGMNMGSLIGGMSLVGPNGGSFLGGGGGMGMSISPGYGHWVNQAGPSGTHGAGGQGHQGQGMMGMSFTQMGSFLNPSSMTDPQIGPGPAGSSVNSAMLHGFGSGNQGIWGVGVGGERSRELEKRYVRDFTCCGLKLGGLHDLLEHYEECHVHLAPDLRKQSMSIDAGANPENLIIPSNPAINAISRTGTPSTSFPTASPFNPNARPQTSVSNKHSNSNDSDAPGTPGMMDIEMDEDEPGTHTTGAGTPGSNGPGNSMPSILPPSSVQWSAFQQAQQPPPGGFPQCVEPSKLSYAIPGVGNNGSGPPGSNPASKPGTPVVGGLNGVNLAFNGAGTGAIGKPPRLGGSTVLTAEQKAERAARKAARKEARRIAKENGELSSDDGRDAEGFKKYRCPVPGCNKSYRQANGLKYHVQRSINSTHGHLVNVPLLPHPNHPDTKAHERRL